MQMMPQEPRVRPTLLVVRNSDSKQLRAVLAAVIDPRRMTVGCTTSQLGGQDKQGAGRCIRLLPYLLSHNCAQDYLGTCWPVWSNRH